MHSMPVTLLTVQLGKKNTDLLFLSMSKFNLLGNGFVKRSDSRVTRSDGSQEQVQLYVGKGGKIMRGDWGENEGMSVNIF